MVSVSRSPEVNSDALKQVCCFGRRDFWLSLDILGRNVIRLKLALALVVCSYIWLVAFVFWGGWNYPGYNHLSQFMSELGAIGSPDGSVINLAGFLIVELLMLSGLTLAARLFPNTWLNKTGYALLLAYAVLLTVSAFYPCDFECRPSVPSHSHIVHMASAFLAYPLAITGLFALSLQQGSTTPMRSLRKAGFGLAPTLIVLLGLVNPEFSFAGAAQRLFETLIYVWLVWWLLSCGQTAAERPAAEKTTETAQAS